MLAIMMAILVTGLFVYAIFENRKKDKSELNIKKYLLIIIIFFITATIIYIALYRIYSNSIKINNTDFDSTIYDICVLILLSMSISLLIDGIFIIPIVQCLYEKLIIYKLEKRHKNENFQYYRDIIKNVSPAILSYCYNKDINIEDEIVSILLYLQIKKIIKLENNDLNFIGDVNTLSTHETFALKHLKSIHNNKSLKEQFKDTLLKDIITEKYIYQENKDQFNITSIMEGFMSWTIIYALVSIRIFMSLSKIGMLVFLAYFLTFIGIPIYKNIQSKIKPIVRTEKGLELYAKLKGLKKYINEYSMIKKSGVENINIFDEYVIYAIIFNLKGKLNNECKEIYRHTKDIVFTSTE